MNKTSIIILTYNNLNYNKACIESIRSFTEKGAYEIIVVDNNSTDGTVEWLKSQSDLKVIYNNYNAGFPKGCNQGIQAACKDNDILLLNNDTIVTKNWLKNLQECLYSDKSVGAVGPVTNNCSYGQRIEANFSTFEEMLRFAERYNTAGEKDYEQRVRLIGFCMLIKREVVDKIGLLDERFTPGNFEDDDYSYRIIKAGYKLLLCRNTFIYHHGSASFGANRQEFLNRLAVNSKKFEEKWGFKTESASFFRSDIVNLMNENNDSAINVLEIGCGCGATLLKIKYKFKNANLYGIEWNKHSAQIASHFADVRDEDVESDLTFDEEFFDYIIFTDILEHLYDPEKFLENMKRYLKKGGHIVACVPNIMHYSVLMGLFNGDFTYQNDGILDKRHIRFFTKNEIIKLFSEAGFSNLQFVGVSMPANEKINNFIDKLAAVAGENKRNQFLSYEYIVKAEKQPAPLHEQISYLLMRIENNLNVDENLRQLSAILSEHPVDKEQMKSIVERAAANKANLLNIIGVAYYNAGKKQLAFEYFLDAFELDKGDKDIVTNVVIVLLEFNQREYASMVLKRCSLAPEEIDELTKLVNNAGK